MTFLTLVNLPHEVRKAFRGRIFASRIRIRIYHEIAISSRSLRPHLHEDSRLCFFPCTQGYPGGTSRVISLKIAYSRSDCARSRAYFSRYFMVKSRNIATFTPEYRLKHVSTHARNHENAYSTADYHLKWLSWKAKLMKPLRAKKEAVVACTVVKTEKAVCLRETNKAGSEPERDYDDHDVVPLVQIVRTRFLANAWRDLAN